MSLRAPVFAGLFSVLLGACAGGGASERLVYSDTLARSYQLGSESPRALQYYVSDNIRLIRGRSAGERGIADGRLVDRAAMSVEEVIVDSGTPGVVVGGGNGWLAVSFERGSYLYFVSGPQQDAYYLYVPDWNGSQGTVRLGDWSYTAVGDSAKAHLLVGRDSFAQRQNRQAKLPGRKLGS